jgi:hypothetical protein
MKCGLLPSLAVLAVLTSNALLASAQQSSADSRPAVAQGEFVVKTVPLHHLTSKDAVRLLSPYVQSSGGGVFEVSPEIRAVTIREVPKIYGEMMAVLGQYDREPATVTLNFVLIAAENTNTRDPSLAPLDSLLRGVLKFSGYRLLTISVANASENGNVSQKLSADGESFTLSVDVTDLRVEGNEASVHLNVSLMSDVVLARGQTPGRLPTRVLSTGVTVPLGQTIVLGTTMTDNGQRALILTVRPQLASKK